MFKGAHVEGTTLGDVWFQLLSKVWNGGRRNKITSGSFAGVSDRLELDFVSGTVNYPTKRPLAPIMPEGISPVTTDEGIEQYFVEYIMDGWHLEPNEHYRYATWIRGGTYDVPKNNVGFIDMNVEGMVIVPDQVKWIINHYKKAGLYNNHCTIQVGYPESNFAYDIPYKDETERRTSPCLRLIDTKIVNDEGKDTLLMNVYFRSWDLYSAWPDNMGGMTMLMEYIASELEIETGALSFCSKGLHVYTNVIEALKLRLGV